jgi:hypothetical protein
MQNQISKYLNYNANDELELTATSKSLAISSIMRYERIK